MIAMPYVTTNEIVARAFLGNETKVDTEAALIKEAERPRGASLYFAAAERKAVGLPERLYI